MNVSSAEKSSIAECARATAVPRRKSSEAFQKEVVFPGIDMALCWAGRGVARNTQRFHSREIAGRNYLECEIAFFKVFPLFEGMSFNLYLLIIYQHVYSRASQSTCSDEPDFMWIDR